jgi:Tfp pilus assembly protein PilO
MVITVVVLGAVLAGAVIFVMQPARRAMAIDRAAIQERRAKLDKLGRVTCRITDLQDEIHRLEQALDFFESRLPREREMDVVLREVWLIAESKSLVPRSIRTRKPEVLARCNSQPINLTLEGPFEGFYGFLLGLEQLPRITKVREMQIQRSPTEEGAVQVDLLMDIFFEK